MSSILIYIIFKTDDDFANHVNAICGSMPWDDPEDSYMSISQCEMTCVFHVATNTEIMTSYLIPSPEVEHDLI